MKGYGKMRKKPMTERRFKCPGCKTIQTAYKSSSHKTANGHVKHMYCVWCKKTQPFVQFVYGKTLSGEAIEA